MTKQLALSRLASASASLYLSAQDSGASHLLLQRRDSEVAVEVGRARRYGATDIEIEAAVALGPVQASRRSSRAA